MAAETNTAIAPGKDAPRSVLFVCAMNAIRSPMAEYLTKHIFGRRIYAQSAGVREGEPSGFAASVMAERGIPMANHHPTLLEDLADDYFDLIITLSPEAHHGFVVRVLWLWLGAMFHSRGRTGWKRFRPGIILRVVDAGRARALPGQFERTKIAQFEQVLARRRPDNLDR